MTWVCQLVDDGRSVPAPGLVGIVAFGKRDQRGGDMARLETGIDPGEPGEAADEEPRHHQEQERHRHFGDGQSGRQAAAGAPPARAPPALLQREDRLAAGQVQRRCEAEEETGGHGKPEREGQHGGIHLNVHQAGDVGGVQRQEELHPGPGEAEPEHAAGDGEEEALGHQLPDDPPPPGADRDAQRELVPPRGGAAQQQVRHVRAGD
ncbi:MAG: hypothetical protein DMF53_21905 [Acidobacteria bacterium]|nr:MAG: hypothetical protein DMF53_21905 [Acidobacteriota bacterium]